MPFQKARPQQFDQYWQTADIWQSETVERMTSELRKAGYTIPRSYRKLKITALFKRKQLDHFCYENCSVKELKKFAIDRQLLPSGVKRPSKFKLAKVLLAGDAEPTFNRFLDLPPELRTWIYYRYMDDFMALDTDARMQIEPLQDPSQPPLARLSTVLRAEVLPIFYAEGTFEIKFRAPIRPHTAAGKMQAGNPFRYRIEDGSNLFLSNVAQNEHIADLRNVIITFNDLNYRRRYYLRAALPETELKIFVDTGGKGYNLDVHLPERKAQWEEDNRYTKNAGKYTPAPEDKAFMQQVRHDVQDLLGKVFSDEGSNGFRQEDFYRISRVVEQGET